MSRPVRFDLCPTNPSVTVSFDLRHRWARRVSRSNGLRWDFSTNKLTIAMSNMSFCNFNSKSGGRRYDFFFHLNTALPFPLQNLIKRLHSETPSSVSSTPSEDSAILSEPCSWKIEIFSATVKFSSLNAGTSRVPPRVLAIWVKPCRGKNKVSNALLNRIKNGKKNSTLLSNFWIQAFIFNTWNRSEGQWFAIKLWLAAYKN